MGLVGVRDGRGLYRGGMCRVRVLGVVGGLGRWGGKVVRQMSKRYKHMVCLKKEWEPICK